MKHGVAGGYLSSDGKRRGREKKMKRVSMAKLMEFGVALLRKLGVPGEAAAYISQVVVETEAFRQSTHGLVQFEVIADALGNSVDPEGEPRVISEDGASALLDGKRCLGIVNMRRAKEMATRMARTHGTGFVGVRRSQWIGALGLHLVSLAEEGFLCQAWAQTSTCEDCAPFGGIDARFSTNPIALAFPTDGNPVLADFSTATISLSGAHALSQEGRRTATCRFLDQEGKPSDDPFVIDRGGTLMFMGGDTDGHKGYALSLFNEALTVMAGGSANNPDADPHQSFSLMVLDPAAFAGWDYYEREMQRYLVHLKSSRIRPDWEEIRLPGERGFAALADCRRHGVPLGEHKLGILRNLAKEHGVAPV